MRVLSRKKGFTLTEILVSILIIGIVMSAVMTLLVSVFKSYEFHQDIMEAKQRGQIALNAIEPLVVNAGLGMPTASDDFKDVFNGLEILFPPPPATEDEHFAGPVQIADKDGNNEGKRNLTLETFGVYKNKYVGKEIWLVYGVQSGFGVNENSAVLAEFTSGDILIQPETSFSDLNSYIEVDPTVMNGWVVFPVCKYPLSVSGIDQIGKKLSVNSFKKQDIYRYDELHYVRAAKISVSGGNLRIDHLMGSGAQPVADGIYDIHCVYDRDGDRILTVTVLSRAQTQRPELNITAVEGWPGVPPADAKYRYAAVSRSWRIRN